MAQSIEPIIRRPSQQQLAESSETKDIVRYIRDTIMTELRSIRVVMDRLISGACSYSVSFGDNLHLEPSSISAIYQDMDTPAGAGDRKSRLVFDPAAFPVANLSTTRSVFLDLWLNASGAGGGPEVALFREDTNTEIAGSRTTHTTGATSRNYLVGPFIIGDGADEMPEAETTYTIRGRDPGTTVTVILEQARFVVRYD